MGLLDAIVSNHFRDDQAGRVVVLPVDRRIRGYLVKSESEELKIRASNQDEVAASDKQPRRPQAIPAVGIIVAVAIAILVGVFLLIRAK